MLYRFFDLDETPDEENLESDEVSLLSGTDIGDCG